MKKITLEEIRDLKESAQERKNDLIREATNKENYIKSLQEVKSDIDKLDVSDDEKEVFKDYIEDIIDANGSRPDTNPLKTFVDNANAQAYEAYQKGEAVLRIN